MASAAILLSPANLPTRRDQETYRRWRDKLDNLLEFRGGYQKLKRLERGGRLGYLSNRGDQYEFGLGAFPASDEVCKLFSLSEAFPGQYLVIWTYGQSITTLFMTATADGARPMVRELSLRLTPLADLPRHRAYLADLQSWFTTSVFSPDFAALSDLYQAPRISVPAWFEAFGAAGAREIDAPDLAGLWADFERVATALLGGERAPVPTIKALNQQIGAYHDQARLRSRPAKNPYRTQDQILEAFYALLEVIGEPLTPHWQARLQAAERYSNLIDCDGIWARLTTYRSARKSGLAKAAAHSRLFLHYDPAFMRDPLFHLLAAANVEQENSVSGFPDLAPLAHEAGFTMAIYPTRRQQQFRQHFGIEPMLKDQPFIAEHDWTAEPFVDMLGTAGSEIEAELARWYTQSQSDGLIFRANPDGGWHIRQFQAGQARSRPQPDLPGGSILDAAQLKLAAQQLNLRAIFAPLGLPDLLDPGDCPERDSDHSRQMKRIETERAALARQTANAALENLPPPTPIYSLREIIQHFPKVIRGEEPQVSYSEADEAQLRDLEAKLEEAESLAEAFQYLDAIRPIEGLALQQALEQEPIKRSVTIRLTLPQADNDFLTALFEELYSEDLLSAPQQWRDDRVIWAFVEPERIFTSLIRSAMLARTLGDLPAGTALAIQAGPDIQHYVVAPDTARAEMSHCLDWATIQDDCLSG